MTIQTNVLFISGICFVSDDKPEMAETHRRIITVYIGNTAKLNISTFCWKNSYITIHHISNSTRLGRELIKRVVRDFTISRLDVG
jgi:hypothetical protein